MKNDVLIRLAKLVPNKSAYFDEPLEEVKEVCDALGSEFKVIELGTMRKVTRYEEQQEESVSSTVTNSLDGYVGGEMLLSIEIAYLRVLVSNYNKKHGTKFRVSERQDGRHAVTADVVDRRFIRQSEYDQARMDFQAKLNILKERIRPDEFFENIGKTKEQIENESLI